MHIILSERLFVFGDETIPSYFSLLNYNGKKYGEISLEKAFKVSSNQVFCNIGFEIGSEKIDEIARIIGGIDLTDKQYAAAKELIAQSKEIIKQDK